MDNVQAIAGIVDWSSQSILDVWAVRKQLWKSNYWPVAVYGPNENVASPGKQPVGREWQERPKDAEPRTVTNAPTTNALNTGILCDGLRAIDIDIDRHDTAQKVIALATAMLGSGPIRRRKDSSRCLILYRAATDEPTKISISGLEGKVEVLGKGQQFVAFGIHPNGSPYQWDPPDFAIYRLDQLNAVTEEQITDLLRAAAAIIGAPALQVADAGNPSIVNAIEHETVQPATEHERAYAAKALQSNVAELTAMLPGTGRNNALNGIAYRMGRMLAAGWIGRSEVESALIAASKKNGYESKDGIGAIIKTLQSGLLNGMKSPHPRLPETESLECVRIFIEDGHRQFDKGASKIAAAVPTLASPTITGSSLIMHRVADVEAQPIRWLWFGRIAIGKVTLISGDPGLGKSQLTAYLAAKVSTGGTWPNNDGQSAIGSVIMLSCEDDVADTIRPRLEAAGANINAVHVIEAVKTGERQSRGFNITADLAKLEAAIKSIPNVRLVTVDPISAYLGGTDTHRTSDVRTALGPLQLLAAQYGIAVVAVSHLNKAGGGGKSVNAVTGSGAFVAAARASFLVVKDEADEDRRLFIESKNNLGRARGLAYRIKQRPLVNGIVAPYVEFEIGTINTTADEALGASMLNDGGALREAKEFLRAELSAGGVPTNTIKELAAEAGIAERTLRRAAKNMGIMKSKDGFQGGWVWLLPEVPKVAKNLEDGHDKSLDTFANLWPSSRNN